MEMTSIRKQKGLGFLGWLVLILLFGGALTLGLKLVPVYTDYNTMADILDGMAAEDGMANKRTPEIEDLIIKRFKINNIRSIDFHKDVQVKRDSNGVRIVLDYEVRMPVVGNLAMVASFDKEVELKK